jgi:hypothetical protein
LNKAIVGSKQLGGWLRRMGDLVQVRSQEISGELEKVDEMRRLYAGHMFTR